MAASISPLDQVLDPLASLWLEAVELHEFCRKAARVCERVLGGQKVAIAFREASGQAWKVFADDSALEERLRDLLPEGGGHSALPVRGAEGPALQDSSDESLTVQAGEFVVSAGDAKWHVAALGVPRPLGALFLSEAPLKSGGPALALLGAAISALALERKALRADQVVGIAARKQQALQLLTLNLNNAYDLDQLSQNLCAIVARVTGVDVAFLFHCEGEGLRLAEDLAVFVPSRSSLADLLARAPVEGAPSVVPLAEAGFLATALATGKPQVLAGALGDLPAGLGGRGLQSLVAVPLVTPRETLGVLVLGCRDQRLFSDAELETMVELAQASTGALLTSRLYAKAREQTARSEGLIAQLRELTRATHDVGKNLDMQVTCQELVEHLPRFMSPIHWVDVYLFDGEEWSLATGSSVSASRPPDPWLHYLDRTGYPPSVKLPREALEGTLFASAGAVLLFPMRKRHDWLGLVVIATETDTETVGCDMVETLVAHTGSAIYNAIQLKREHQRSITDALTNVYNRRYFNQRLVEELEKGERYLRPFSLVLLDIDLFKVCNDILGHVAGDILLREFAGLLRVNTRKVDIVARYGGEEFVVILPETAYEGAWQLAEKLRAVIDEHVFRNQDQLPQRNVTASLGFATYPQHGSTAEGLIRAADEALYRAKQSGRNLVGLPALADAKPSLK